MKTQDMTNDYELVYMYRQNKDLALELLMNSYKQRIWKLIYQFPSILVKENRDEIYHLCTVKLIDALDSFRVDKHVSFYSYYMRIVRNMLIDTIKKQSRYEYRMDETTRVFGFEACDERGHYLKEAVEQTHGFDDMTLVQIKDFIDHSDIRRKKEAFRIVEMRMQGYKYDEIAQELNINKYAIDYLMRKMRRNKNRID